jgi:hypothetical protein
MIETIGAFHPNDKAKDEGRRKTHESSQAIEHALREQHKQQNACGTTVGWKIKVVVSVDGRKTHSAEAGG